MGHEENIKGAFSGKGRTKGRGEAGEKNKKREGEKNEELHQRSGQQISAGVFIRRRDSLLKKEREKRGGGIDWRRELKGEK